MKLFTFRLQKDKDDFGIQADYIYRVLDDVRITPVCLMPPFYLGLHYYRGELFDVIDLNSLLGQGNAFALPRRLMVLRWGDRKLALAPGHILGLLWIEEKTEQDTFIREDGRSVRLISPQDIWDRMEQVLGRHQAERPFGHGAEGLA